MNNIEAPRPLNLGEILDRTVQLYRQRFLVYLGIAIIPTGVLLVFGGSIFLVLAWLGQLPNTGGAEPVVSPAATAIGFLIVGVIGLVALVVMLGVSSLSTGAMNHAVAGTLAGMRPTIRGSYREAWRRGWMYLGLYVLEALIVWGVPAIVWFVAVIFMAGISAGGSRGAGGNAAGVLVGMVIFFGLAAIAGYALWMLLCVSLAFPGCVVEAIDAVAALKRSFRLSKGTRGRIFVLYLLGYVLGSIVSMVVMVIFAIAIALIPGMNSPQRAQAMGMAMVFLLYGSSFAVQALTKPVYAIALMLFYYDQRIRKEGYDIEWMMERAGLTGGVMAAQASEPVAGSNGEPRPVQGVEWSAERSGDAAAAWSVESPLKLVEMRSRFVGEEFGLASAEVPTEATIEPGAAEAAEKTKATQPENGVQG
jgi:hypothetical protein